MRFNSTAYKGLIVAYMATSPAKEAAPNLLGFKHMQRFEEDTITPGNRIVSEVHAFVMAYNYSSLRNFAQI